jgi:uncharacterized cupin superfamily protein
MRVDTSSSASDRPFEDLPASDILSGSPTTSTRELWTEAGPVEAGVWVMTPGVARDTEAQEIFVVLAGRATITVGDAAPRTISTGDIVSFDEGDETVWNVHETLRKFYVTRTPTERE